jgi:hypothetical protein
MMFMEATREEENYPDYAQRVPKRAVTWVSNPCRQQRHAVLPVTPPQRRLFLDPPQPFQPALLHPQRRAAHRAGDEIHHRAQMADHRHDQPPAIVFDPRLPLARAQRDHQKIRAAGIDAGQRCRIRHLLDIAEPRAVEAHATHAR